jgi:hypothetical protein
VPAAGGGKDTDVYNINNELQQCRVLQPVFYPSSALPNQMAVRSEQA